VGRSWGENKRRIGPGILFSPVGKGGLCSEHLACGVLLPNFLSPHHKGSMACVSKEKKFNLIFILRTQRGCEATL
jgi:hypothetical protein